MCISDQNTNRHPARTHTLEHINSDETSLGYCHYRTNRVCQGNRTTNEGRGMSNNDYIIKAVKGEPNSLTSIAFNTGVIAERKRIIKLLESYANAKCDEFCAGWCDCFGKFEAETFIALIKGENK